MRLFSQLLETLESRLLLSTVPAIAETLAATSEVFPVISRPAAVVASVVQPPTLSSTLWNWQANPALITKPEPQSVVPQDQFQMAGVFEEGYLGQNIGFGIESVQVISSDGSSGTLTLMPTMQSKTVIDVNTADEVWRTANGEVEIDAHLTQDPDNRRMQVQVTAGTGWTVQSVSLAAPFVYSTPSASRKTYSAFNGGVIQDWDPTGVHQQNSSVWPDTAYSPLAVFYDQQTTEGVGFVSFDSGLKSRVVYWYTFPTELHALVRWDVNLSSGQTDSTTMELHHGYNMPTEEFQHYRDNFLKPFMDSQGIPEGNIPITGVMATSGWPLDSNVQTSVEWATSWHASGYLQYAPPDGSEFFEPNPQTLSWYPTLKPASQVPGNQLLGVLIDPYRQSYSTSPVTDINDPAWFPSGGNASSLNDPGVMQWMDRLKTNLVSQGVNFAFWDTGGGTRPGQEQDWFNIIKTWKAAGISIAAESSNDLASYITGAHLMANFKDVDNQLMDTITPLSKVFVIDPRYQLTDGTYWWDTAQQRGYIPILAQGQLEAWGQEHGYQGITIAD